MIAWIVAVIGADYLFFLGLLLLVNALVKAHTPPPKEK